MLSLKLKAIAFFIDKDDFVVDIGCDHAYLDIYLAKNKLCKGIIASDINKNALNIANANIQKNDLQQKIKTILSDGLKKINTEQINTIVIAGMGTKTIKNILNDKEKLTFIKKMIISSNNDHYSLRKYMQKNGYKLVDEKIIYEKNHYYVISKYEKGKQKLRKKELLFGLYKKENKLYYQNLLRKNKSILKKIPFYKYKKRYILKHENRILKKYISFK